MPFNMLALNQAICWNTLYVLFVEIGQSAGNLLSFSFSGIFRYYTLEFLCSGFIPLKKLSTGSSAASHDKLAHYLAGLIDKKQSITSLVVWGTNLPSSIGYGKFTKVIRNMVALPPLQYAE
jgi:hypothetical protein